MSESSGAELAMKVVELNLRSFKKLLVLAESQARAAGHSDEHVFAARLAPDMLPFGRQVVLAAYFACAAVDRLKGDQPPPPADMAPDFGAAVARLDAAIVKVSEARERSSGWVRQVDQSIAGEVRTFLRDAYLAEYLLPSFMFHWITGYGILRNRGYSIGKKDFLNLAAAA